MTPTSAQRSSAPTTMQPMAGSNRIRIYPATIPSAICMIRSNAAPVAETRIPPAPDAPQILYFPRLSPWMRSRYSAFLLQYCAVSASASGARRAISCPIDPNRVSGGTRAVHGVAPRQRSGDCERRWPAVHFAVSCSSCAESSGRYELTPRTRVETMERRV